MADMPANGKQYASKEQLVYAGVLDRGMKIGFVMLVLTFVVYLFGFSAPHVPHEQLAQLWGKPVGEYLRATNTRSGWTWVSMIGKGDYINFVGIVVLSSVTVICYLRILPILISCRDKIFTAIAVLEVLVLALAASGILASGH